MIPSLVDRSKISRDPRKLAYLYPSMPVRRYKELTEDYHRSMTLAAIEQVARMMHCVLMPASCIHHDRRRPDRRMQLHGRTYYVVEIDDVTELEWAKYDRFTHPGELQGTTIQRPISKPNCSVGEEVVKTTGGTWD